MSSSPQPKSVSELLGAPCQPKNARERLLSTAVELFYRKGFNAVGIDQVIAQADVSKTTFYKYFDSKDDFMVEAVRQRDDWEMAAWDRAVRERVGDDPAAQLLAYFEVLNEWFNAPDFGGCLFINVASEFPNPHDPVHQAAASHKRASRDAYRDLAAQAGIDDPDTFADHYTMIMEGALVLRQVHDRNDAAEVALAAVKQLLAEHLPGMS